VKNGVSTVDLGSVLKFIKGVNDFLSGDISLLGPKMQAKHQDVTDILDDSQVNFVLIIAYTGKQPLATEVRTPLDNAVRELNDDGEFVTVREFRQKELHDIVAQAALGDDVNLEVMLHDWGKYENPYKVYYGQASVSDITGWGKYGDHLYHKNIRGFKGSTEVNDSISATLTKDPDNFFSFNNGITLLCSELEKKPLGGKSTKSGVFECKGASVINGAQTVGTIIGALEPPATSTAKVMVRLISLQGCPPEFSFAVTKATNTQNKIEKRDFAALDDRQAQLRTDMWLSLGKEYVFKGDHAPSPENGCTLDEAAVALACAQADISYAMIAKREVSRLYEDIKKPPYTILFNSGLTALKIWRAVHVLRAADAFLSIAQKQKDGKERGVAIHGNRVLLYLVFRELPNTIFEAENADQDFAKIPEIAENRLGLLSAEIIKNYSGSYPAQLFKNVKKCTVIADAVIHPQQEKQPILGLQW
jgi:hypothetical protein